MIENAGNEVIPSRRRKVVFIPERFVLSIFNRGQHRVFNFPEPLNLPEGTIAVSAHHDWLRNAFAIVIEHESFDEVSENIMLPEVSVVWQAVELKVEEPS